MGKSIEFREIVPYRSFEEHVNYFELALTFPFNGSKNGMVYLDSTYTNDKTSKLRDI